MALLDTSLANICDGIRDYMQGNISAPSDNPSNWITVGAPGVNYENTVSKNALNLFFYRFEPFGFAADAMPGDVQFIKVFCIITAFGVDIENAQNGIDASAGFNELRMLSEVMRLFQEQPIMLLDGSRQGQKWHIQFIPRPLVDEQINQIWSTQGNTVYRPSLVYEIALAPIEPETPVAQSALVASVGTYADSDMSQKHKIWPEERETVFFAPSSITIDTSNPQWAPAIAIVTGVADDRHSHLTLNMEVNANGPIAIPDVDIWIAGDPDKNISIVGQLLQAGHWTDINIPENKNPDIETLDMTDLPNTTQFTLKEGDLPDDHWTGLEQGNDNWQLQLFAERRIKLDPVTGHWNDVNTADADIRIRSNPVLITVVRKTS